MPRLGLKYLLIPVIVVLGIVFFYLGYRFFNRNQESEQARVEEVVVPQDYFKNIVGEKFPLGISQPQEDDSGNRFVSLIGVLEDTYEEEGEYFLILRIPQDDSQMTFRVALGNGNYTIAEYKVYFEGDLPTSESAIQAKPRLVESYSNITSINLLEKYKDMKGKVVRVDILTKFSQARLGVGGCNNLCTMRLKEFEKYSEANLKLEDPEFDQGTEILLVGAPTLISLSE